MTIDGGMPIDQLSIDAASQLVKLAVSDGWTAVKGLVQRLVKRGKEAKSSDAVVALPVPSGALDEAFTHRLAAYLSTDRDLRDAVLEHFNGGNVGTVQVLVQDHARAAIQGSGIQNNDFRAR